MEAAAHKGARGALAGAEGARSHGEPPGVVVRSGSRLLWPVCSRRGPPGGAPTGIRDSRLGGCRLPLLAGGRHAGVEAEQATRTRRPSRARMTAARPPRTGKPKRASSRNDVHGVERVEKKRSSRNEWRDSAEMCTWRCNEWIENCSMRTSGPETMWVGKARGGWCVQTSARAVGLPPAGWRPIFCPRSGRPV
jgi:hypothetical protein